MAGTYGKGDRGKATKLHSLYIRKRANNICERCGLTIGDIAPSGKPVKQIHCAHIISRHVAATRTDEDNAFCLCASDHFYFGKWPIEFAKFVFDKIGWKKYEELLKKAQKEKGKKVNWKAEVERLEVLLKELKNEM